METVMTPQSEERKKEDLERLKDWLSKQPHLPKDFDEGFLQSFLRGTKSIEIAKQKLESFCSVRSRFPQYFKFPLRDPLDSEFLESCRSARMFVLPEPSPEGYRVLMAINKDFSRYDPIRYYLRMAMMLEVVMSKWPATTGLLFVFDCDGIDASIFAKIQFTSIMFIIQYLQTALPVRMKGAIVYNTHSFFERLLSTFFKPYIKKKLYDRISLSTKGPEVLKGFLPLHLLPSDCPGGEAAPSDQLDAEWRKILEDRRDWFLKTSSLCSDETKRPPDSAQTYGVDGTFRKLTVD